MTYFGETIRKAREAKGMTTSQVAEKTRILVQIINAMEREDFSPIKAAIYGRGFVKLICECLDLDPKPLVAEFMDIYEGRRPPVSADVFQPKPSPPTSSAPFPAPKPEATPEPTPAPIAPTPIPEPVSEPAPEPVTEPSSAQSPEVPEKVEAQPLPAQEAVKGLDLFDPPPVAEPPPPTRVQDIFSSAYASQEEELSRGTSAAEKFRTGLSVVSHGVLGSVRNIPRSAWRMAVLVLGALVVVGLMLWGCIILYRVTEHPADPAATPDAPAVQPKPAVQKAAPKPAAKPMSKQEKPPAKPQLRSTGEKVPPLYVD